MADLIEHGDSDDSSGDVVSIGSDQSPITLKVYQDIYHQITGRTEQIKKRYRNNILLDFSGIEQLHYKIMQLCDVYEVVASNEIISVFYEKERKEQFTSFERFKAYNSNTTKPTVNVVLKYNFSIIISGRKQPQEYVVTVKLTSRVAMLHSMEEEVPPFMRGRFFGLSMVNTAEISVEYVDYVVARSFLESFDEWMGGCNSNPKNRLLDIAQGYSYFIPKFLRLFMGAVLTCFFLKAYPDFVASASIQEWGRFFIIFGASFYFVTEIAQSFGKMIEKSIDRFQQVSYLNLNKGDQKLIERFSSRNRLTFWKFLAGCALTVFLGVVSSKLSGVI